MSMRWLGVSIVVLLVSARVAAAGTPTVNGANTTLTAPYPNVSIGAVPVGLTGANLTFALSNTDTMQKMDLTLTTTCTGTGTGTFSFDSTMNINPPANVIVTYVAMTRGARSCRVDVSAMGNATVLGSFTVSATGVAPIVDVRISTASVNTFAYGSVRTLDTAAQSTVSQSFAIHNIGDTGQVLSVTGISFGGTDPTDFTVTGGNGFPQNINQGSSQSWTITFNPGAAGGRSGTMLVATNDPATPMRMVTLTGTGTNAVVNLTNVTFPTPVASGIASASAPILNSTLSNSAASNAGVLTAFTATITPLQSSGTGWFSFGAQSGNNALVNCPVGATSCPSMTNGQAGPGALNGTTKGIPVRCHPPVAASGTESATLAVTSDSDSTGVNQVTITCTAGRPNIVVDTSPLDFGNQLVNTTSTAKTVTISNNGNTPLTFYYSETVGGDNGQFGQSTPTGCGFNSLNQCTIAPSGMVVLSVTFTPASMGAKAATLVLNTNDPDAGDNALQIELDGVGIAPVATPNPLTTLALGSAEVGKTTAPLPIVITNTGTSNLTISNAVLSGAEYAVATGTTGAQTTVLAPNASAMWTLTCSPTGQGGRPNGTFTVTSNSGNVANTMTPITLTCSGNRGFLTIAPTSHNFLGVREGDTRMQTFTLTNTGNLPVTNITYVADAKLLGFTVSNVPTTLMAGQSVNNVTVTFTPVDETYGCAYVAGPDCSIVFSGDWGVTPTKTMATLVVQGDGLKADYDTYPASPNALDFGNVRQRLDNPVRRRVSM